ncbi:hypothetical protein CBL_05968 [Carabus blaptoides fortunei]
MRWNVDADDRVKGGRSDTVMGQTFLHGTGSDSRRLGIHGILQDLREQFRFLRASRKLFLKDFYEKQFTVTIGHRTETERGRRRRWQRPGTAYTDLTSTGYEVYSPWVSVLCAGTMMSNCLRGYDETDVKNITYTTQTRMDCNGKRKQ